MDHTQVSIEAEDVEVVAGAAVVEEDGVLVRPRQGTDLPSTRNSTTKHTNLGEEADGVRDLDGTVAVPWISAGTAAAPRIWREGGGAAYGGGRGKWEVVRGRGGGVAYGGGRGTGAPCGGRC